MTERHFDKTLLLRDTTEGTGNTETTNGQLCAPSASVVKIEWGGADTKCQVIRGLVRSTRRNGAQSRFFTPKRYRFVSFRTRHVLMWFATQKM